MYLKSIEYGNDRICKAIIVGDKGQEYVTSIDGDTNETWCTCPFYTFRKITCKHMLCLLDNLDITKMKPTKRFKNFLSGCLTIDTLMGNGFPQGSTVAVFAESGTGKTLLSAQLALSCVKNLKKDVIVLETEGNREQDYLELLNRFSERWGVTEKEIQEHIHYMPIISSFGETSKAMQELLKMVGYEVEIDQSKKGDKYSITFRDSKPKLKEDILKNTGLIVIDSLTEPIKTTIGHKSQNLPARSELISRFFYKLISIARDYNICVVLNHHSCHDNITLTLTKERGIVGYKSVNVGDSVLALNDSGKVVWTKVKDKYVYDYDDEMVLLKGKSVNQCVTPNHRVYSYKSRYADRDYKDVSKIVIAGNLTNGLRIPKASYRDQISTQIKPNIKDVIEKYPMEYLEGWYIAEGYSDKPELSKNGKTRYGVRFCVNRNDLKSLLPTLDKLNITHWESKESNHEIQVGISRKELWKRFRQFGNNSHNKIIPIGILNKYNNEQLESLMYGYLHGDGRNTYKKAYSYTTVSRDLVKSLIILCAKIGYSITYRKTIIDYKGLLRTIKKNSTSYYGYIRPADKSWAYPHKINYKGKVWCLTTELDNFLIIRDGKPSFSGNSVNPLQLFGRDFGKPYGGDEVLYNSKYILALVDSDMAARAKYGDTARRVFILKHPYQAITKELLAINLKKDYGFTDEE